VIEYNNLFLVNISVSIRAYKMAKSATVGIDKPNKNDSYNKEYKWQEPVVRARKEFGKISTSGSK
jgi:hypothetical protein